MTQPAPANPCRRTDVAEITVGVERVLGHESLANLVTLDPVTAVLWDSLDGISSVADLADDLADAFGIDAPEAQQQVDWFVRALGTDGLLDGVEASRPTARQWFPPVPANSCIGKRIGLGGARLAQVTTTSDIWGSADLRIAASSDEALELALDIVERFDGAQVVPPNSAMAELVALRSRVGGGVRVHQLFDSSSHILFASRDRDDCIAAFLRTVAGQLHARCPADSDPRPWLKGPSLLTDRGVTLLHPSLHEVTLGPLRLALAARDIGIAPAGMLRFDAATNVATAVHWGLDRAQDVSWPILGVAMPPADDELTIVRRLLDVAWRWDQVHFDAIDRLRYDVPVLFVQHDDGADHLVKDLCAAVS